MSQLYEVSKLIANSHFHNYLHNISSDRLFSITSIIEKLLDENKDFCDDHNFSHLSDIFITIAVYQTLISEGIGKEEAYQLVSNTIWDDVRAKKSRYQFIYKMPFGLNIARILIPKLIDANSGLGWKYVWHPDNKNQLQYECHACLYQQLFNKYGLYFLGPIFCYCDILKYTDMYNVEFKRLHTLCNDGQPCDFLFTEKKNK